MFRSRQQLGDSLDVVRARAHGRGSAKSLAFGKTVDGSSGSSWSDMSNETNTGPRGTVRAI